MTSHKRAVIFAISNGDGNSQSAFRAGATFALERPLSTRAMFRTLKASYPMMARERRRCFRCPLQIACYLKRSSAPEIAANAVNISEGGMAFDSPEGLQIGEKIQIKLCHPGTTDSLTMTADVGWTNPQVRTGVQFQSLAPEVDGPLQAWLSERMREYTPDLA